MQPWTHRARGGAAVVLALVLVACGGFPRPYTAAELRVDSRDRAGAALVHYLGQTGADVGVCAPEARVLVRFGPTDVEAFLDGLDDGDVAPSRWTACARQLLSGMSGGALAGAVAQIANRFTDGLDADDDDLDDLRELLALGHVLDARPNGVRIPDAVATRITQALAGQGLGTRARVIAATVYEGLEMERGRLRGQPVTRELLATIEDVPLLRRLLQRLPTADGRAAGAA